MTGACVEFSISAARTGVRDSKNQDGGVLTFDPVVFHTFLASMKDPRS